MKSKPRRRKPLPNGARILRDGCVRYCPTCGHPIILNGLQLSPTRRRILEVIERHGEVANDIIHAAIWGSDPNGGPDPRVIHVHIHHLNRQLAPYGMRVLSRRGNGMGAFYRLGKMEAAE